MFRPIPGYPTYLISKSGIVKNARTGKRIKPQKHGDYVHVGLRRNGDTNIELVHRLVASTYLGGTAGMHVDHINFRTTDNRVSNLQLVSPQQNAQKSRLIKPTQSGFKGVYQVSKHSYAARIWHHRKSIWLGCHRTPSLAARAYNDAAIRLFGRFAVINKLAQ